MMEIAAGAVWHVAGTCLQHVLSVRHRVRQAGQLNRIYDCEVAAADGGRQGRRNNCAADISLAGGRREPAAQACTANDAKQ
jgi:hypothetical protein